MIQNLIKIESPPRNVIFLSHATPEDNDFTIWLASRLQADGYEVWIDKKALLGGEKFWEDIDQVIRNQAVKFLLVYSKNICKQQQPGKLKDGVYKEKSLAESISKDNDLNDFIILLNVDGSHYNLFIGADMLNQIPFYENWATGYTQLQQKFKKDGIGPTSAPIGDMSSWYEDKYITSNGIQQLREIYYDSRWPIPTLPETFYMYVLANDEVAYQVQQQSEYPVGRRTNIVTTFHDVPEFEITLEGQTGKITFKEKYALQVSDVLNGVAREGFPSSRDAENHLKTLLKRIFHMIMRKRGLRWHEMSNKNLAYFFTPRIDPKIKFQYTRRSTKVTKKKNIFGKHYNSTWHFAVSVKPILTPQLSFSLKSHIIFTTDGFTPWEDKDKMHTARRQKGRLIFNEEWRDLLFAYLHALCQGKKTVRIRLSPTFALSLPPWTNTYMSDFGYFEPKEKDRHNILDFETDYYDLEDESDTGEDEDV